MPLVTVIASASEAAAGPIARDVVSAVADALGRERSDVWARVLQPEAVVGGGPLVTITGRAVAPDLIAGALQAASAAVAAQLGCPPSAIWARFDLVAAGSLLTDGAIS